ncbi:Pyridoxine 4-dehydrogenase [Ascosphaera pollenicola]|nr:Pyridoxine 4-dehydrogenase [Ascosphaera pollenicola]
MGGGHYSRGMRSSSPHDNSSDVRLSASDIFKLGLGLGYKKDSTSSSKHLSAPRARSREPARTRPRHPRRHSNIERRTVHDSMSLPEPDESYEGFPEGVRVERAPANAEYVSYTPESAGLDRENRAKIRSYEKRPTEGNRRRRSDYGGDTKGSSKKPSRTTRFFWWTLT